MGLSLADFENGIPIFQILNHDSEEVPFNLPKLSRKSVSNSVRCEEITFIPHAHCTHLESVNHLRSNVQSSKELSLLLSKPLLSKVVTNFEKVDEKVEFVIIKKPEPKTSSFDGVDPKVVQKIVRNCKNLKVIGINEPSFDPEFDGGNLSTHHSYFESTGSNSEIGPFLIELLDLSDERIEADTYYWCFLNVFRFPQTDAYPCSPILYPFIKKMALSDTCIFCKIIRGAIPSFKIYETQLTYAFLDVNPLSEGHILVIPKFHGARLHEIPDGHLADVLPVAKKILIEGFGENGAKLVPQNNILQNNGRMAHQEVDHVHFHIIPKPNEDEGLGIKWPSKQADMSKLKAFAESIKSKIAEE